MTVYDVWFWAPFHMLQAYPIARNLPFPDVMIPFVHLIWVPFYIWEHWTGLAEPVEEAWAMKPVLIPLSGILLLAFFYITHQMSEKPTVVKIGTAMYFAFMFFAKDVGFQGSPKKIYVSFLLILYVLWYCPFRLTFHHQTSLGRTNRSECWFQLEQSTFISSCLLPRHSLGCSFDGSLSQTGCKRCGWSGIRSEH